jgi:hypothetical protein
MSILQWSPELNEAALRLKSAADAGDVVATNGTLLQPFPAVITNLRMLLAGRPYVDGYTTKAGSAEIQIREELLENLLVNPSPSGLDALHKYDVRWLWLQGNAAPITEQLGRSVTVLWQSKEVTILQIINPT